MTQLNSTQLLALKNNILAETDPVFVVYRIEGQTTKMAEWYNQEFAPAYVIWRNHVTKDQIMQNGFDWVRVDNLTVGKARIWEYLFDNDSKSINPSKLNVRLGIAEAWKGTAADLAVQAVVLGHCKKNATRAEQLFSTGLGTTASPSDSTFFGFITDTDIVEAVNL